MTSASSASSPTSSRRVRQSRPNVRRIRKVNNLLDPLYGPHVFRSRGDALTVLVQTILSQNTSDTNSSRAFSRLRKRFPTWEQMANADPEGIEAAISSGGLGAIKAPRIKRVLQAIRQDSGSYSLDHLKESPAREGLDYLCSLDGVGRKTASCVLLFALGMPVFPVDTHVHRLARRLGWVPLTTGAERAGSLLDEWVPAEMKHSLHFNLVAQGRAVCQARNPKCSTCVLCPICPRVGIV